MKKSLLLLTLIFIFSGCGKSSFTTESPLTGDTIKVDDVDGDLVEIGDIEDDSTEDSSMVGTSSICESFEAHNNEQYELYMSVFPDMATNCDTMSEQGRLDFLQVLNYGNYLFEQYQMDHHNICRPLARRALRKIYTAIKRERRYDRTGDEIFLLRNEITLGRIDRIIRKMVKKGCLPSYSQDNQYVFDLGNRQITYSLGYNFLINASFELIRFNGKKTRLEDGWTIVNSNNAPGWKVENSFDSEEELECNYLEIQTSGVVTNAAHGNQLAELDSHCTDIHANKKRGDATIQISQSFPVNYAGTYSLRMKAQKRQGRFGELELSVFQRRKDHSFTSISLSDQAEWQSVCHEYEVTNTDRNIKIVIRDGDNQDRETFGILLDDVEFVYGGCDLY